MCIRDRCKSTKLRFGDLLLNMGWIQHFIWRLHRHCWIPNAAHTVTTAFFFKENPFIITKCIQTKLFLPVTLQIQMINTQKIKHTLPYKISCSTRKCTKKNLALQCFIRNALTSVSYTHLDVYKRQIVNTIITVIVYL